MARRGSQPDSARFERSARFWMRAYPRRWRVARGEELLGVLRDLAAPGERRVGVRTAVDLVKGGWATRWRGHPPLLPWLGYRHFDRRLPEEYREWAKDDIDGALYAPRVSGTAWWLYAVIFGVFSQLPDSTMFDNVSWPELAGIYLAGAAMAGLFAPGFQRRRALLQHLAPRPGDPLYEGRFVVRDGLRLRVGARSGLVWTAASSGVLAAGSLAAIALAPLGTWAHPTPAGPDTSVGFEAGNGPITSRFPAYAVVLVGLVLAVLAVRRVRRWLPQRVEQPHRLLRPVGRLGALRVFVLTALGAGVLWLEIVGAFPLFLSPVLAAAMLVSLGASEPRSKPTRCCAGPMHRLRP